MKKLFLAGAIALMGLANAQEYKPEAGDVTAEFVVSGGVSDTSFGFREGGMMNAAIRGRYFKTDKMAYRGAVYVGTKSTSQDDNTDASTSVDLAFGIEKHFNGTKNLSPYVGGEAYIGFMSSSSKVGGTKTTNPTTFGGGIRGVFGADYYFVKNVYLGVEAGLGIGFKSEGEGDPKQQETSTTFEIAPAIAGVKLGFVF